jgi:hypothetical protein
MDRYGFWVHHHIDVTHFRHCGYTDGDRIVGGADRGSGVSGRAVGRYRRGLAFGQQFLHQMRSFSTNAKPLPCRSLPVRHWVVSVTAIAIHHNHNRHSPFSITIPFTLYLFAHIGMQVKPNFTQKLHHQTRGILGK